MNHKRFADTSLTVPELAFGTWQYLGGVEPLRTAIELGAAFIDTAEAYGTEQTVGQAIKGNRHRVFLASKVLPRHFKKDQVGKAIDASLTRLGTDYIDLYQLHWPNYTVPIEETMVAMERQVESGKVRFIGVSNFSVAQMIRAQAALSKVRIATAQVRYSLVDRTIEIGLLQYCLRNNISVLAFSSLAHGLQHIRKRDPEKVLDAIGAETGRTAAQVALNWCISHESVIAICKAAQVHHVRENCGASGWTLSSDHFDRLTRSIRFYRRSRFERFIRRATLATLQQFGRHM